MPHPTLRAVSISMKDSKNIFPGAAPPGEAKPVYWTGSEVRWFRALGENSTRILIGSGSSNLRRV